VSVDRIHAVSPRRVALWCVIALLAMAASAGAARAASWQFTPVDAPVPPAGTANAPYPVPLGQVGQLSFWAPNRGLLITGGTEATGGVVPAGLYAYDGVSWHLLSSVCGGAYGRIAWAGPDEFWTISDQRAGQVTGTAAQDLDSLSLCHFLDGQVVASYAEPLGQVDSYEQMDAAACTGPDDCWFGGQDTTGPDPGAFQLHWDGAALTALQEPEDHAVDDMTDYHDQIYESVRLAPTDTNPSTAVLHRITTAADPFSDVYTFGSGPSSPDEVLPEYGSGVSPDALEGFSLSTDGGALGAGATQLWAVANPESVVPTGSQPGSLTILHNDVTGWSQVTPGGSGGSGPSCAPVPGEVTDENAPLTDRADLTGTSGGSVAALPGTDEAWLSLKDSGVASPSNPTGGLPEMALVDTAGCVTELDDQFPQQPDQSDAPGATGPVACPAADDCWMATAAGWLYHYTDGTQLAQDTDPNFTGVITTRPADAATPTVYADVPPPDDSGTTVPAPPVATPVTGAHGKSAKAKPLLTHVKFHLIRRHTVLVMSFRLSARARVQIVAERKQQVVARSRRAVLKPGRRSVHLKLNPKHYPTHIKINAKPVATS
jgi:hypothetical protein